MKFESFGANHKEENILKKKLEEISMSVHNGGLDPDGNIRFKDQAEAIAFQELAEESGLKVKIVEPSIQALKRGGFLSDYFIVKPVEVIEN